MAGGGLTVMLPMTLARSGAGDPLVAGGLVEARDAWLNLALNLPNVKGTSPSFQCHQRIAPAGPSYGGVTRRVQRKSHSTNGAEDAFRSGIAARMIG